MRKIVIPLILLLLIGCEQQFARSIPPTSTTTSSSTATSEPTTSVTPILVRPSQTPRPSPTSFPTPKQHLIKLFQAAGDGVDEIYICSLVYTPFPRFILYEDGQLIYYNKGKLMETVLTSTEISELLGKVKETGYF